MHSRRSVLKGTATLIGASAAMSALSMPPLAFAKAPLQAFQAPGFYRIRLGELEVTALSDGTINIPLPKLYTNTTEDHARTALSSAFQDAASETSVNAFLVNTGERLVLIDAGTGTYLGPSVGKLIANIGAAGYRPEQIDDVILTHVHTDHSGGLVIDGKRAFINATVHVNKRDADFWLKQDIKNRPASVPEEHFTQARECLTPYVDAGKFRTFDDNADVLPGIASILRAGHTPGHSSLVVESSGKKLVFWGDITHGDVLQFDEPGVAIEFDVDQKMAIQSRDIAFQEAADQAYLVAGAHIAFPGIGHVRRDATNYDWVPLNYSAN